MSTFQKTAQREGTSELKYTTDGKVCFNKLPSGDTKGTAHWEGNTLIVESSQMIQNDVIKSREVWTVSGDGKVLTIATHLTLPQQGEKSQPGKDWPIYGGSYNNQRYSSLKEITPANARSLQGKWMYHVEGLQGLESVPVVVNGVMYVSG